MLAGRALAGLGAGAASVLVPRYLAEVAPLDIRGAVGTLTQASPALPWGNPAPASRHCIERCSTASLPACQPAWHSLSADSDKTPCWLSPLHF